MSRIAIVIAFTGFRDEELLVPYQVLTDKGCEVVVYSTEKGIARGKLGATFQVEHVLTDLNISQFDALVLIGGPGGYEYIGNTLLSDMIKKADREEKWIAAICMAPQLVAQTGLLRGRNATIFAADQDQLVHFGAIYTGKPVEVDGRFITADGPSSAMDFARTLIEKLHAA